MQHLFLNNSPLSSGDVIQIDVTDLCSQFLLYSLRSDVVSPSCQDSVLPYFSLILADPFFDIFCVCTFFKMC